MTPTDPAADPDRPVLRAETVLRPATADDVGDIARIWDAGWADGHLGNVPDELVRHRGREQFLPRARERFPSTWVSMSGGRLTGFVVVVDDEVEQIYVDSRARGSGVAAALLRCAEDQIRRTGHSRAWLAVVAGNSRARSFYERQGWQDHGAVNYSAETADGPVDVPCRRYERALAQPTEPAGRG